MNALAASARKRRALAVKAHRQMGLTLVELMVAMVIGLVVVLAASAALLMSRQGFTTVDAAAQLNDNGRFASDFIQRLATQAGYTESANLNARGTFMANQVEALPPVTGFDHAVPANWNNVALTEKANCARGAACGDVLILSNQLSADDPTGKSTDASAEVFINCVGAAAGANDTEIVSAFYIDTGNSGEPALMCRFRARKTGKWTQQPVVQGVENFQVLYGVNAVAPNTASAPASRSADSSVPTRFLRAEELIVPGDAAATANNWRRVRTLRIGMVLRGPLGSASVPRTDTLYPLGIKFSHASDTGAIIGPAQMTDTRLRSVVSFTVQLRNYQE